MSKLLAHRALSDDVYGRFWAKVEFQIGANDECWPWLASVTDRGYGKFWTGQRLVYAHRFAYEMWIGPIPEGLQIDHLCRNRRCCNPNHLEAVTQRENILRGEAPSAVHARKTHCPQGHPYDEENTRWEKERIRHCRACKRERIGGAA